MQSEQHNVANLLLLEANEQARDALDLILADRFAVDSATNCENALELIRRRQTLGLPPYDAILLDLELPNGPDGYETLHHLRGCEGYNELAVPAVAFTDRVTELTAQRCVLAGFEIVLAKPFRPDALEAELELLLGVEKLEPPRRAA